MRKAKKKENFTSLYICLYLGYMDNCGNLKSADSEIEKLLKRYELELSCRIDFILVSQEFSDKSFFFHVVTDRNTYILTMTNNRHGCFRKKFVIDSIIKNVDLFLAELSDGILELNDEAKKDLPQIQEIKDVII